VLLRGYREMRRLRLIDAKMILLQRQGRVGFYGACTGQEAVPIAAGLVLAESDWVFPALREQSVMLVRGFPLTQFIAQVFGNSGDVQKGRQMPSHHSGRSVNQVSWSSCIGPQVPQAVGTAWAMKLRNEANKAVSMGFLGDGATSQPDFHNAMTFAGLYRVPAVIVCQNNHWSISVPTHKQTAAKTIAIKGARVRCALGACRRERSARDGERARRGRGARASRRGPTFVEALTYRIGAHSTSDDPTRYRDEAEVEAWRKKDPLDRLRKHLVVLGLVDDASDAALEAELTAQINAAVKEVEELPPPDRETLFDDVYADLPWHLREQKAELMASPKAPAHGG
jgi:pyruvate dehydrogenase E1 component alpha subunit